MAGSVDSAKDVTEVADKAAAVSPADLLKRAVAGKAVSNPEPVPAPAGVRRPSGIDARIVAAATVALAVGTSFGMVAAPRERSGESLARIEAGLDAGRIEASRLNSEIERLSKNLVSMREATESSRSDVRATGAGLTDRMLRLEQSLDKKFTALTERVAHADREQPTPSTVPTAAVEKRATAPVAPLAATSLAVAAAMPRSEPTQTASLADTKPKSEMVETWALRDVYDGIAMLEDRKRRLLEVAPGDLVPGIGRVESIERRGRIWVVVTKQGVISPQTW